MPKRIELINKLCKHMYLETESWNEPCFPGSDCESSIGTQLAYLIQAITLRGDYDRVVDQDNALLKIIQRDPGLWYDVEPYVQDVL